MGFRWTRCRRCARALTDARSKRRGLGPECKGKDRPLRGTALLMDAIDTVLDGYQRLPTETWRDAVGDAELAAQCINLGATVKPRTARRILRQARTIKETTK